MNNSYKLVKGNCFIVNLLKRPVENSVELSIVFYQFSIHSDAQMRFLRKQWNLAI